MTDHVVHYVGAALLLSLAIVGAITGFTDRTIPDALVAAPTACLAFLGGLYVTPPTRRRNHKETP